MASIDVLVSVRVEDADHIVSSIPLHAVCTSGLIADVIGWAQGIATEIDTNTGLLVLGLSIAVKAALPGGLKTTPTAGCEMEKCLLQNFHTASALVPDFSIAWPGWPDAGFLGEQLNTNTAPWKFWDPVANPAGFNTTLADRYFNVATTSVSTHKTFRKHRKPLKAAR